MSQPFDLVVVHGLGFRQSAKHPAGLEEGPWVQARRWSSPRCWIMPPLPWNTDAEAIAALIARHTTWETTILGRFYSWGAGWFFPRLAKALASQERFIRHAALADPVYRSPWLPASVPLNPLSMVRGPRITVPDNVLEVEWTRQRTNRPAGHDLVAADASTTTIHKAVLLKAAHRDMDNHAAYWEICIRSLERFAVLRSLTPKGHADAL